MRKYYKYDIVNEQPLKIANISRSQTGDVGSISYIPGSSIRGMVINKLVNAGKDITEMFSDKVCFLNAYPVSDNREFIPSPMGFYEDKKEETEDKELTNMLANGGDTEQNKRASLCEYSYFEEDKIYYSSLQKGASLNIKTGAEKEMFRSEYIDSGYTFRGYISVEDGFDANQIIELMKNNGKIYVGSGKSSGYGRCLISSITETKMPYVKSDKTAPSDKVLYMMLLSPMTMIDKDGENVGIDIESIKNKLGVEEVSIELASTGVEVIRGYNRKWCSRIPAVSMYSKGSVFKLRYDGTLQPEKLKEIEDEGLGIRRNEGYGRVIFVDDFDKLRKKTKTIITNEQTKSYISDSKTEDDDKVERIIMHGYYLNKIREHMVAYTIKNSVIDASQNSSQYGNIRAILLQCINDPEKAKIQMNKYFEHAEKKDRENKQHGNTRNRSRIKTIVMGIMNEEIVETLKKPGNNDNDDKDKVILEKCKTYLTKEELGKLKIQLIIDLIDYENRKKVGNTNPTEGVKHE